MQSAAVLLLLLATGAAAERSTSQVSASAWLRGHPNPANDELNELKNANPDAYALVKALLTKRSLGLLDPKHPTASFAAAQPHVDQEQPAGGNPFAQFAQPGEIEAAKAAKAPVDEPVDEASYVPAAPRASSGKDWLNWKPASSGLDDDAMVKNVLGAVAGLTGARQAAPVDAPVADAPVASSLSLDEGDVFGHALGGAPSAQAATQPMSAEETEQRSLQTAAKPGDSYLKISDPFAAQAPVRAAAQPAHFLKPVDSDSLSWHSNFDDKAAPQVQKAQPQAKPANSLMAWLGKVQPTKQAAPQAAVQAAPVNNYLAQLQ